ALLLPPAARRQVGDAPLDLPGKRQRGTPYLGEGPAALDPAVDVDPSRAGRLRPPDEPEILERLSRDEGDLSDGRPRDARDRVQVHPQLVGVLEVVGS